MKLPRFGVEGWLNSYEREAVYDIAGVSIEALTLQELFELTGESETAFYQELLAKKLNYGWIEGSPEFKKAVSQLYDVDLWQVREENKWLPDLAELRQLIRPNTKMICINNANNPTGAVMDDDYLRELVSIAKSCGAYILADEVYHPFTNTKVSSIIDLYEKGISVNSLSKTFSLPGIRVGWVAACDEVTDILRDYRDYTMICAGVFDDMVASLALKHKDVILERNRKIIRQNLEILDQWVKKEKKASYIRPAEVPTSFVKLEVDCPIEEFCLTLLKDYGVLLVPGNRFDREGYVRLGYSCKKETLEKGLELLSLCLNK